MGVSGPDLNDSGDDVANGIGGDVENKGADDTANWPEVGSTRGGVVGTGDGLVSNSVNGVDRGAELVGKVVGDSGKGTAVEPTGVDVGARVLAWEGAVKVLVTNSAEGVGRGAEVVGKPVDDWGTRLAVEPTGVGVGVKMVIWEVGVNVLVTGAVKALVTDSAGGAGRGAESVGTPIDVAGNGTAVELSGVDVGVEVMD